MTNEQFDDTAFHRDMMATCNKETVYIKGIDFYERKILYVDKNYTLHWVDCKHIEIW